MSQHSIRLSSPVRYTAAVAVLLLAQQAVAADWKISPSLNFNETYSDNIRLAASGNEKSDWVTQVNPGIAVTGTGSRLKANASYTMQNLVYAEGTGQDTTRHQLNAAANAELIDHLFFLDGRAAISQQNTSIFGSQATDNVSAAGNRTEVKTYNVSPYLRNNFGNFASSEVRYTHNEANTGTGGLSDSQSDSIQLSLKNGASFKTLGWGLNYSNEQITYTNLQDFDREALTGNLRYLITPKFGLTATGGYERNNYVSIGSKPEGSSWSAGVTWAPSTRTSFEASAGQRFFGKTYMLNANHQTRSTAWALGYSEDITTTQSQFQIPTTVDTVSYLDNVYTKIPDPANRKQIFDHLGLPQPLLNNLDKLYAAPIDPVVRQQIVGLWVDAYGLSDSLSGSSNFLTNRVFLQKRLQASVAMTGAKNTLVLSLFNSMRQAQTAQSLDSILLGNGNLSLNDNTRQMGGNAVWNWRINSRTGVNFSAGYNKNSSSSLDLTNHNKRFQIGMTRQFQHKLSGTVSLRRNQQSSNQIGGGYQENAVTASLLMNF